MILGFLLAASLLLTPRPAVGLARSCDPELGSFYRTLNEEYFGGTLGPACIQYEPRMLERWVEATTNLTWVDSKPVFLIKLDSRLKPLYNDARMSVVHEACHVKTYHEKEQHGPRWKTCMRYLAVAGAMDAIW